MNRIDHTVRIARRRLMLARQVRLLAWSLVAAAGLGLALLVAERSLSLPAPSWAWGVAAGLPVVSGLVLGMRRRPTRQHTAAMIDHRLGLKDRLGTAMYVRHAEDQPFAREVVREAESAATAVQVRGAFPVAGGRAWPYVPAAAAVLGAAVLFWPSGGDWLGIAARQAEQETQQAAAESAEAEIVQARLALQEVRASQSQLDEAAPDELLDSLAELTRRDLSQPELSRQTAAELSRLDERLSETIETQKRSLEAMQNRLSALDPGQRGPADRFADALRRGDFDAAARELDALAKQLESEHLTDAERRAAQQQLANLAEQLEQLAQQQAELEQQAREAINQQLADQGLSQQQIQQLAEQNYPPDAVREALEQQGLSAEEAQQIARQVQQQQQSSPGQSPSTPMQGLSQSLNQMANSLGQQQPGQGGSQVGQGAWSGGQQLSQLSRMQQQLQQQQLAQGRLRNAMQQAAACCQGGGVGGRKAGTGPGGNPLGPEGQTGPYQTTAEADIRQGSGRIIASWQQDGEMAAGEPTVGFDTAVTEARTEAERAVTEDRVPRRYHGSIREYFNQLPEQPGGSGPPPAAPR